MPAMSKIKDRTSPRPRKSKKKRTSKVYIPPFLDRFPLNPITTADADPHRDAFPVAHSPIFPNATLLNLVWLEAQGYPRHSGIVRDDQIFTAEDHHRVTLAANKYGADFEAVAREVGRPQWAIASFHEWQNYIVGVWFVYQVVERGRKRRWSEAEITRAIGTTVQMLSNGTWEEDFAAPWTMAQIMEENEGRIPDHLAQLFSGEALETERVKNPAAMEQRRMAQAARGGGGEEEEWSESESESESESDSSESEAEEDEEEEEKVVVLGGGSGGEKKGSNGMEQQRRRQQRAVAPSSSSLLPSSLSVSSSSHASAATEMMAGAAADGGEGRGEGEGGLSRAVGSLVGEGVRQEVVVHQYEGEKCLVGMKGMVGVSYHLRHSKWRTCAGWYKDRLLAELYVGSIREASILQDGVVRLLYGITATCNFSIDTKIYLAPFSGAYRHRKRMRQGRASSNHNLTPCDREYVKRGIFNLEQLEHYERTGEVRRWCDSAEGKRVLYSKERQRLMETILQANGREGAAYGDMRITAASSEEEKEEEDKEDEDNEEQEEGRMVAPTAEREGEEEDDDEWDDEGGEGSSDSDSSGGWETFTVPKVAVPPTAASLFLTAMDREAAFSSSASLHYRRHHHQEDNDDAGSESSWELLQREEGGVGVKEGELEGEREIERQVD